RFSRDWSSDVCSSDLSSLYIPEFHDVLDHFFGNVAGYGEGIAHIGTGLGRNGRIDPDKVPIGIDQGPATVARVYRGIGLDKGLRSEERRVGKECRLRW